MPTEEMSSRALPQSPNVNNRIVITAVAAFLVFVVISMTGIFFYLKTNAPDALRQPVARQFPQPELQTNPQTDLMRFQTEQHAALAAYAWIDRGKDLAKIPIEDAMRVIAARGDHAYDPPDPLPPGALVPQGATP